jgi:uncharacterized protein (DUF362 family)
MSQVAIIRCESYNSEDVKKAIERGINLLGGIGQFVKKGEHILLKPNLISGVRPEKSVTTHPVVFEAVASLLMNYGVNILAGDGPGVIYSISAAKTSGIKEVTDRMNIPWDDFKSTTRVEFKGIKFRAFDIASAILANDGVISLPKFKTHELTTLTGCVKNQYGCLSFADKRKFHALYPDVYDFTALQLDLNKCINPRLYIVDGIHAMEGNGPLSGDVIKLNTLIISNDPIAADSVMCRLIGLNPEYFLSVKLGQEYGYGSYDEDKLEIVGDDIMALMKPEFKVQRSRPIRREKQGKIKGIAGQMIKKPKIIESKCTRCGECVDACPFQPKALTFYDDNKSFAPVFDYSLCIRCFCCHEMCRYSAIVLKYPFYKRLLNKLIMLKPF